MTTPLKNFEAYSARLIDRWQIDFFAPPSSVHDRAQYGVLPIYGVESALLDKKTSGAGAHITGAILTRVDKDIYMIC